MSEFSDARYKRAVEELHTNSFKRVPAANAVLVRKISRPGSVGYLVKKDGCSCSDFTTRCAALGEPCKHMIMVALTPLGGMFQTAAPGLPAASAGLSSPEEMPEPSSQEIAAEAAKQARDHNILWEDNKTAEYFQVHARTSLMRRAYRTAWFEKHATAWEETAEPESEPEICGTCGYTVGFCSDVAHQSAEKTNGE